MDPDDPDNRFVHLTNHAVQKFAKDFGEEEEANIMSFDKFQKLMDEHQPWRNFSIASMVTKMKQ